MPWVTPATDALDAGGAAAALETEPGAGRPAETWLATNPSQLALPFPDRRMPFASGPTAPAATAWFDASTQGRLPDCSPLSPVVAPEALPGAGVRASALMEFNEDWPTLETDATVPGSLAPPEIGAQRRGQPGGLLVLVAGGFCALFAHGGECATAAKFDQADFSLHAAADFRYQARLAFFAAVAQW